MKFEIATNNKNSNITKSVKLATAMAIGMGIVFLGSNFTTNEFVLVIGGIVTSVLAFFIV